ncbi:MAG: type I-E CRISPR-associated protein Cse1/CasA [Oscillospiraceae bacterium]
MTDIEFNLIDEPWVRVMQQDCSVREVSLRDAIVYAHEYRGLGGELPTQDVAVLRLMLAVLHTVFSRVDAEGNADNSDKDNVQWAKTRWQSLWERGCFSEKAIDDYFAKWHERFWLFHPERPFGQVAGLTAGTDYDSPKLNGEISESSNKARFFSSYFGAEKQTLSYAQSARWLLYLNAYDDTSAKPTKEGKENAGGKLPSPGAGWLGKLGLIYLKGNTLFETLMLNLIMINGDDETASVQGEQKPAWEAENVAKGERTQIRMPNNLAELYTLQSRRILLHRKDGKVTSYRLLGGDFFEKENAFFEPMTVWRTPRDRKGNIAVNEPYVPKRHDSAKQMWREFAVLYNGKSNHRAGVLTWYDNYIFGDEWIDSSYMLQTVITAVEYGDKDFFVKNVFSDSLQMHSALLSDFGENFRADIENEIKKCEEVANSIGRFAVNLYIASGGSDDPKNNSAVQAKETAQAQLYYRLDMPFRNWLMGIDPDTMENTLKPIGDWRKTVRAIALQYANEQAANASDGALVGHMKSNNRYFSVPQAMLIFKADLKRIYGKEGDAS